MRQAQLVDDAFGPALESPADEILEKNFDADTKAKRRRVARRALGIDLDCIDAYTLLAIEADSLGEAIALLREAVRIGERHFAPLIEDEEMEWWGFMGTRPYMRAIHELALALEEAGDTAEAEALYRRLLQMNPDDNQGVRALLLRILSTEGRKTECAELLAAYPEDYMLEMMMAWLWLDLTAGDEAAARARLPQLHERNEHVLPALATALKEGRRPQTSTDYITVGGEDEAASYVAEFFPVWKYNEAVSAKFLALSEG